jgi:hypothetical protein
MSCDIAKTDDERTDDERIDLLEAEILLNHEPVVCPIRHLFTRGMYIREMSAPAGALITSKIHKTEHPFTISKGSIRIRQESGEWVTLTAPFTGVTKPGTRRVAIVLEDCIWTTYHGYRGITGKENVLSDQEKEKITDRIEARIIKKRYNKFLNNTKLQHVLHSSRNSSRIISQYSVRSN